jgi:hypothetical protein
MNDKDREILAGQYKAYLADLWNIGQRHEQTNKFFISVLSAFLVFLSLTGTDEPFFSVADGAQIAVSVLCAALSVF